MKIKNSLIMEKTLEDAADEYANQKEERTYYNKENMKKLAQEFDAKITFVDNYYEEDTYDELEYALDEALEAALTDKYNGVTPTINVLAVGRGGTGKTSRINKWAEVRGITLVQKDANTFDPSDMGGLSGRKYTDTGAPGEVTTRLASTEFDALMNENTVLFLDEFNRAYEEVRSSLLTLINDHKVPDPRTKNQMRELDGMLFTVAAMNPPDPHNQANLLSIPMLSRFGVVEVESNLQLQLKYLQNLYKEYSKNLHPKTIRENKGRLRLATALLTHENFKWDGDDEERELHYIQRPNLSPRTLTNALKASKGQKDLFLNAISRFCNPDRFKEIEEMLGDYHDVDDKANSVFSAEDIPEVNPMATKKENNWDKIQNALGDKLK